MLYNNEEMALEGWLRGTGLGQRQAGGGKETGRRALGERPSSATLGGQLPSTSPTCSCDGKERSWDVEGFLQSPVSQASWLLKHLRWVQRQPLGDSSAGAKGMWGGKNMVTKQGNNGTGLKKLV